MAKVKAGEVRFIVNPVAGAGAVGKLWPRVHDYLRTGWRECDYTLTEGPGHAVELAQEAAEEGLHLVVAVGGDGTANEVANGLLAGPRGPDGLPQTVLGIMPFGTGSDLRRTLGIPRDYRAACGLLDAGRERTIDLGRIAWGEDGQHGRYFLNVAGLGFDGEVVERVESKSKLMSGTLPYLTGLFQTLVAYSNKDIEMSLDGQGYSMRVNSVLVCNGRYFGGGMFIAPQAAVDNGLFEVITLGDLNRLELVANTPRAYRGTHLTHPKVDSFQARRVQVVARQRMLLQADGELIGEGPALFALEEQALRVWVPEGEGA